ncbi:uncharacterized protein EI97DRAFT_432520 [Westerdykella ornata]|uniref:J domain-containing protein n=1 Tax=Westerdykella ornata TaxID=318751 RepID=A0A6A6JMD9_WESOR|nr:uncharacterized protein EI97DRAFT_432520 [Westerdykella ornata]KAF2277662.1 hypothetical protein EI97DRAFT_432520 [Westerdykella ornata]
MTYPPATSAVPSGIYLHPISLTLNPPPPPSHSSNSSPPTSPSPSSPSSSISTSTTRNPLPAHLPDHYAVLHLDTWATSEEIKSSYRSLRAEYFRSDPAKYRALQAAYAVLVDAEARRKYDVVYRASKGLPVPVRRALLADKTNESNSDDNGTTTASGDVTAANKGNTIDIRKDAAAAAVGEQSNMMKAATTVRHAKSGQLRQPGRVQLQASKLEDAISLNAEAAAVAAKKVQNRIPSPGSGIKEPPQRKVDTIPKPSSIPPPQGATTLETKRSVETALELQGPHDPNHALKNHGLDMKRCAEYARRRYQSNIPILEAYKGRHSHPELLCTRPKYVLEMARMALP